MYLLDTNVLIEAERTYYDAVIAPPFWTWLISQHRQGNLASIKKVYQEINKAKGGYLKNNFAHNAPKSFWIEETDKDTPALRFLSDWARERQNPKFKPEAVYEFLSVADYYLVAQAKTLDATVVTREQPEPRAIKRVLIPDACQAAGVSYMNPFEMYRKLGLKFQ